MVFIVEQRLNWFGVLRNQIRGEIIEYKGFGGKVGVEVGII